MEEENFDDSGEGLGPVVLEPRDRVVVARSAQHVDVAVAVDVDGEDGARPVRQSRDDVLPECVNLF